MECRLLTPGMKIRLGGKRTRGRESRLVKTSESPQRDVAKLPDAPRPSPQPAAIFSEQRTQDWSRGGHGNRTAPGPRKRSRTPTSACGSAPLRSILLPSPAQPPQHPRGTTRRNPPRAGLCPPSPGPAQGSNLPVQSFPPERHRRAVLGHRRLEPELVGARTAAESKEGLAGEENAYFSECGLVPTPASPSPQGSWPGPDPAREAGEVHGAGGGSKQTPLARGAAAVSGATSDQLQCRRGLLP